MTVIFNTREAAEYLRYSEVTLENWRSQGKGPRFHKPEDKVLYYKADLDAWVQGKGDQ